MPREPSDLTVISKTKDLLTYILKISENAPKKFRFTLTSRLINSVSDALQEIIMANEAPLVINTTDAAERKQLQHKALAHFKVTDAFAMAARQTGCITADQYRVLSNMLFDCIRLTAAWIKSDARRLNNSKFQQS